MSTPVWLACDERSKAFESLLVPKTAMRLSSVTQPHKSRLELPNKVEMSDLRNIIQNSLRNVGFSPEVFGLLGAFGAHVDETAVLEQEDYTLVSPFLIVLRLPDNCPLGQGNPRVFERVSLALSRTPVVHLAR